MTRATDRNAPPSPPTPPTHKHTSPPADPEEGVDPLVVCAGEKQRVDVDVALSNSFGFGGHNSCVLFSKYAA